MSDLAGARDAMIARHLVGRGVANPHVLDAMRAVPREEFVGADLRSLAYDDGPLPIGAGQTISQPYIVALMIEVAGVRPGARVLEVGAGCGYAAAVMSRIAARVHAIELHEALAQEARARLARLGYDNIELRTGDGTSGWPEAAPFDAILVSAGGPNAPDPLLAQLAVGGALVIPVGPPPAQRLVRIARTGEAAFHTDDLGGVAFVPLVGKHGWADATMRL
jgi:protein-L-isoaspartate(D-aspartate) O-methyltransferase